MVFQPSPCPGSDRPSGLLRFRPIRRLACGIIGGSMLAAWTPSAAEVWSEVPRPSPAYHASAVEAGHEWLYAAWCVPTGTTVALFRTPLASPGTWERLGLSGHPIHDILLMGAHDDTVFVAANSDTCVYRSYDGGHTWQIGDTGMPMESAHAVAWSGAGTGRLLVEGREIDEIERLYVSDDLGQTWSAVGAPFLANYKPFLATPGNGSSLVYETVYGGFWISFTRWSTDGGSTWQVLPGGGSWSPSHDLDIAGFDPQCVCVLTGGAALARWCETTSLGEWPTPWTAVGVSLPAWEPGRLFLVGLDAEGRPVAAWRDWGGTEWNAYSEGLPSIESQGTLDQWLSYHLAAALDAPVLFYATKDHGLWRREVTDLTSAVGEGSGPGSPTARVVASPNPSRGSMRLRVAEAVQAGQGVGPAGAGEASRLAVFDVSGRLERLLTPAAGQVLFDGRDEFGRALPAGVYLVRSAGGGGATQIVLVR